MRDHPCVRREYVVSTMLTVVELGSPLRAQGILVDMEITPEQAGITPACAGNTGSTSYVIADPRDHPCVRREYGTVIAYTPLRLGSPLRAQGILPIEEQGAEPLGITPACAGNTITRITTASIF